MSCKSRDNSFGRSTSLYLRFLRIVNGEKRREREGERKRETGTEIPVPFKFWALEIF